MVIWISYFRSCKMVNHPSMRHNIAGYLWHVGMKYQWFSLWTGFDPHVRTHSCWWLNEIHVTSCYYHMTGKKTFVNLESWDEATRTIVITRCTRFCADSVSSQSPHRCREDRWCLALCLPCWSSDAGSPGMVKKVEDLHGVSRNRWRPGLCRWING